jgi:DNA-binding NarL/FixJ family response regulator
MSRYGAGNAGLVADHDNDGPPTGAAPTPTGIVLVDARAERRAVLRTVIEHSDVPATVLGEADGQADAIDEVERHAAALVLIDFQPPVQDGLAAVAALRSRFPALVILVCSFDPAADIRQRALAAGADAYLLKPVSGREVMAAMGAVPPRPMALQSVAAAP